VYRFFYRFEIAFIHFRTVCMLIEVVVDIQTIGAQCHIVRETCPECKRLSTLDGTALHRERILGSDVDDRILCIDRFIVLAASEKRERYQQKFSYCVVIHELSLLEWIYKYGSIVIDVELDVFVS